MEDNQKERDETNDRAASDAGAGADAVAVAGADEGIGTVMGDEAKDDELDKDVEEVAKALIKNADLNREGQVRTDAVTYWGGLVSDLREVSNNFDVDCDVAMARDFVEKAKVIPYLTKETEQIVTNLEHAVNELERLSSSLPTLDSDFQLLSDEDQKMIMLLPLEHQSKMIQRLLSKDFSLQVTSLMKSVAFYLGDVTSATIRVNTELASLSGLSQAEGSVPPAPGTGTQNAMDRAVKRHKTAHGPLPKTINAEDSYSSVLGNSQDLDKVLSLELIDSNDCQLAERLRFVHESVEAYLDEASFIQHNDSLSSQEYKKRIQKGTEDLYMDARKGLHEPISDSKVGDSQKSSKLRRLFSKVPKNLPPGAQAFEVEGNSQIAVASGTKSKKKGFRQLLRRNAKAPEKWAPGAHAFEVEGTQQWLSAVIRLIGECLQPPYTEVPSKGPISISPVQKKYVPEAIVQDPAMSSRPRRRCDMMLTRDGRHIFVVYDDIMELGGEAKPGSREGLGPSKLFCGGTDQDLAHAAKSVGVGFNFAGPGVPTHATMFVVNMAAVKVLQLRLENVGTPGVKLVLYQSKLHPLLSVMQYDRWAGSAKPARKNDFAEFRVELYGDKGSDGLDPDGTPSGFRVLCALMQKRRKDLFGPTVEAQGDMLGDVLGTGSFSVVFVNKKATTQAVKLSRYGNCGNLQNEHEILKRLGNHSSANVSRLVAYEKDLPVVFQNVSWKLPALVTTPVGMNSLLACSRAARAGGSEKQVPEFWLKAVLEGLTAALNFIHKYKIIHRDVNPSNVVIVPDDNNDPRPVLTDFSIAFWTGGQKEAIGFAGTANYTDRGVFNFYPGAKHTPLPKHDMTSLGLTMATFMNCGSMPWSPIVGFPKKLNAENRADLTKQVNARQKSALATLEKRVEAAVLQSLLKELLLNDTKTDT